MKKKYIPLVFLGIAVFSLTACEQVMDMFTPGNGATYSYREIPVDIPTPNPGNTKARKSSYTYKDYTENNAAVISSTPCVGEAKLLVIPVWFSNSAAFIDPSKKDSVKEDIEKAYFGTNEDTGWRSVKTYYEEESHGALKIDGTVSDWYEISGQHSAYIPSDSGLTLTTSLVTDAVSWYFNNHTSESRKDYDCDEDGYLDGVMLIYAAPDYDTLGIKDAERNKQTNLWAYCFWTQNGGNVANPIANAFFWASYDFMYGSEKATARTGKAYKNGDTSIVDIDTHTYIHEMGHMFGLTDYYDYSEKGYSPAAGFSMQDSNVGGHDPFSSFSLGWGKAYVPTETTNINLKKFASTGEMIVLTPSWNENNSAFDEYLVLEYYDTENNNLNSLDTTSKYMPGKKYPEGTKDRGIRLWHIDGRLLYNAKGNQNYSSSRITTNPRIPGYKVVSLCSNTYYDGKNGESDYLSPLFKEDIKYGNYNILQLIRNDKTAGYQQKDSLTSAMLFKKGEEFSMSVYGKQFVNTGKFNNGSELGFTFKVNALNSNYASITVTKL